MTKQIENIIVIMAAATSAIIGTALAYLLIQVIS